MLPQGVLGSIHRLVNEALAFEVLVIMIIPLHIEDIKILEPIVVQVAKLASPLQPQLPNPTASVTSGTDYSPGSYKRLQDSVRSGCRCPGKAIAHANVVSTSALFVGGVMANVA